MSTASAECRPLRLGGPRLTLGSARLAHGAALSAASAVRSPAAPREGGDWQLEKLGSECWTHDRTLCMLTLLQASMQHLHLSLCLAACCSIRRSAAPQPLTPAAAPAAALAAIACCAETFPLSDMCMQCFGCVYGNFSDSVRVAHRAPQMFEDQAVAYTAAHRSLLDEWVPVQYEKLGQRYSMGSGCQRAGSSMTTGSERAMAILIDNNLISPERARLPLKCSKCSTQGAGHRQGVHPAGDGTDLD